jgi:hypothetical protein
MTIAALALSVLIIVLSAVGIVAPSRVLAIARWVRTPVGLYAIAALRVLLGAVLFLAAPGARAPQVLRILGILTIVAGVVTPMIGIDRTRRIIDWVEARGPGFIRGWSPVGIVFGLLLIYAIAR